MAVLLVGRFDRQDWAAKAISIVWVLLHGSQVAVMRPYSSLSL